MFKVGWGLLNGVAGGKEDFDIPFKLAQVGVGCGVGLEANLKMKGSE